MFKFLANIGYMFTFVVFMLFLLLVEAGCAVVMVVGAVGSWCGEQSLDSIQGGVRKFKKTCGLFLSRVWNFLTSRYELSFKEETLFKVGIKTDKDALVKYSHMVGTVRPGSFEFELEPITYSTATTVEKIELEHMCRPVNTILGPIHMMNGDVLKLSYKKIIG
jgi:hypothetical protein